MFAPINSKSRPRIIRAVRPHRGHVIIDPVGQIRCCGNIANMTRWQFHRDDVMRFGLHAKARLAVTGEARAWGFDNRLGIRAPTRRQITRGKIAERRT